MNTFRFSLLMVLGACSVETPLPGQAVPDPGSPPVIPVNPAAAARGTVPLYGGTMERSESHLVVADPGTDDLHIVDLSNREATPERLSFADRSEPFRIAIDDGTAYVTLRGTGEVASVDLEAGTLGPKTAVCAEPRGVATDATTVYVACASGEVVKLDRGLEIQQTMRLEADLRDVVIEEGRLWVSTFRLANVIRLDPDSLQVLGWEEPSLQHTIQPQQAARVAWRMRAHPYGGVLMMHMGATTGEIPLEPGDPTDPDPRDPNNPDGENPYGGDACLPESARSSTHFTRVTPTGQFETGGPLLGQGPRYDFAIDADLVHIANGGFGNSDAFGPIGGIGGSTTLVPLPDVTAIPECVFDFPSNAEFFEGLATSIAVVDGVAWLYSREPSQLWTGFGTMVELAPANPDNADSYNLFHQSQSTGLACASCHPEGQDDGHVWTFQDLGPRRTQNIAGGVASRAPFHWDSEFESLDELMHDVFEGRMGGPEVPPGATEDLAGWMDDIPPLRSPEQDADQVAQGKALFESPAVACSGCHNGEQLTDSRMHVVRAGDPAFKTPSLLGVGGRAPYMHDGCAESLEQRFTDEACGGGDQHGVTSQLSDDEVRALIAFLKTL
ncbi:MAG: c-type cytochrome [Myxococcota bacterium]